MTSAATDIYIRAQANAEIYDLVIGTLGYEQRSSYIPISLRDRADTRVAIRFQREPRFSMQENESLLSGLGFTVVDYVNANFLPLIVQLASSASLDERPVRLAIDVSSMSRPCIASIINAAHQASSEFPIDLDIVYTPAKFSPPNALDAVTEHSGPVIPEFSGFSSSPEMATAVILGLGYEFEKALGAIEYLDASHVWCFEPASEDPRYDTEVASANESLFNSPNDIERIRYSVADPTRTYLQLEALVYNLKKTTRVVLLPFGPKLFSAICSLVAASYYPDVTQWRVSGGANEAKDCVASGLIHCLPVTLRRGAESSPIPAFDQLGVV